MPRKPRRKDSPLENPKSARDAYVYISRLAQLTIQSSLKEQPLDKRKSFGRDLLSKVEELGKYLDALEKSKPERKKREEHTILAKDLAIAYLYATYLVGEYKGKITRNVLGKDINLDAQLLKINVNHAEMVYRER